MSTSADAGNTEASEEAFWLEVRAAYPPQEPLLNLNNAAVGPPPLVVEAAVIDALRLVSRNPDVNMWSRLDAGLPQVKRALAEMADCSPEEVALNRNSTEALCTAIFGIPLSAGDQILACEWDYPSMLAAWRQRAVREGVELVTLRFDQMAGEEAVLAAYENAMGPRVRVLHLTHMIHWTGRTLPVQRLCQLAREHGVLTVVDAAQTFAQTPLSFRALGCDYLATSLHKWLGAPVGNGMLLVRGDRIEQTFPLLGPFEQPAVGIDKFDHWNLGTYNSALQAGILPAVEFHRAIGTQRVHARLGELTRYWISLARDIPGFRLHTPLDENLGGLTLFSVDGCAPKLIERELRDTFRIHVKYRECGDLRGIRVSPHVYMTRAELARFVEALMKVSSQLR